MAIGYQTRSRRKGRVGSSFFVGYFQLAGIAARSVTLVLVNV